MLGVDGAARARGFDAMREACSRDRASLGEVIILGVILLVLGLLLSVPVLWVIGLVLVVVGAVLWIVRRSRARDRRSQALLLTGATYCRRPTGERQEQRAMAHDASDDRQRRSRRVAIIGAGPGGICTGVACSRADTTTS